MTPLDRLRAYLDRIGFAGLYRYIVTPALYASTPRAVTAQSRDAVMATHTYLDADLRGRGLAYTFLADAPIAREYLDADEQSLAGALVHEGILRCRDGVYESPSYQLICADHLYLLIDVRVNFPSGAHDVYIGEDTYSLLYYLAGTRIATGTRMLDLGTGTGILALSGARRGATATATDIAPSALRLATLNAQLNGLPLDVRDEDHAVSLATGTWDLVVCNPPFIAAPQELAVPVFARGDDRDGLGHLRRIITRLPEVLARGGEALLVAEMLGDARRPHFLAELGAISNDASVEVYVERILPIEGHLDAMTRLAIRADPARTQEAVRASLRAHLCGELGARNVFLIVIRIRRDGRGLAIFNRWLTHAVATHHRVAPSDA